MLKSGSRLARIFYRASLVLLLAQLSNSALATPLDEKLARLEFDFDGHLGVYALNTANHQELSYRAKERFPLQSTFKLLLVAAILKESEKDPQLLKTRISYSAKDLVFWSPISEKQLKEGMLVSELAAAAMSYSDNTATNLLMKNLGGPFAVNSFARTLGDIFFRVNHWEPELNSDPSNPDDSSTPAAMAKDLEKLTLGNFLSPEKRELLVYWMRDNQTGATRIRAALPSTWQAADKTGSGTSHGVSNDIALIWPPNCPPILLVLYSYQNQKTSPPKDQLLVRATRLVIDEFSQTDTCVKNQREKGYKFTK